MRRPGTALWHRRWAGSKAAVSSPDLRSAGLAFSGRQPIARGRRVRSAVGELLTLPPAQVGQKTTLRLRKNRALRPMGTAMAVQRGRRGLMRLYRQILSNQRLATARPEGPVPRNSADQHRASYMSVGLSQCNAALTPESRRQFAAAVGAGDLQASKAGRWLAGCTPCPLLWTDRPSDAHAVQSSPHLRARSLFHRRACQRGPLGAVIGIKTPRRAHNVPEMAAGATAGSQVLVEGPKNVATLTRGCRRMRARLSWLVRKGAMSSNFGPARRWPRNCVAGTVGAF